MNKTRFDKFVEYQYKAPIVYLPFIKNAYREFAFSDDDLFFLNFAFCFTYCEVTAIYIVKTIDRQRIGDKLYLSDYRRQYKKSFSFNSAREKAKNLDRFCDSFYGFFEEFWTGSYIENLWLSTSDWYYAYEEIKRRLMKIRYIGEFSAHKFMEVLLFLQSHETRNFPDVKIVETDRDDFSGTTVWMLRILWEDELVYQFKKWKKLSTEIKERLSNLITKIEEETLKRYGVKKSPVEILPKCCSFWNLRDWERYWWYHHDRQLERCLQYKANKKLPNISDKIFKIRKDSYDRTMLWELYRRSGIRKERKNLWREKWLTGVELR